MNERLRWLRNSLKSQGIQGMIISNPINIKYLTNISAEGILLMTLRENVFITDDRYIEEVRRTLTVDDEIVDTVVLSEKNEWKRTFKDLDVYKEGKLIEYKINEIKVPEYDTFIEGDMTIGFTVINVNYAKGGDNPPTADFTIYYIVLLIASFLGIIKFSIVYIKNN